MLSPREWFICQIDNQPPEPADAIIVLTGGGTSRVAPAANLHQQRYSRFVFVSGGLDNPPFSLTAKEMANHLYKAGVPSGDIEYEGGSTNTREQAVKVIAMSEYSRSIILVTSHYHQYRAYLTFLKAMEEANRRDLRLISATAEGDWEPQLLEDEFRKIELYRDHVVSYEEANEYLAQR